VAAGEVEIKTRNGDFVQSYTDTFFTPPARRS
jgi:hypothetical protein